MLTHSVDDAEDGCIQLYSVEDVTQISDFLSTTFYRHYFPTSTPIPQHSRRRPSTIRLIVETPPPHHPCAKVNCWMAKSGRTVREAPAPAPAPYYEEDHVEYYGEDPEYLETTKPMSEGGGWMRSGRRILR